MRIKLLNMVVGYSMGLWTAIFVHNVQYYWAQTSPMSLEQCYDQGLKNSPKLNARLMDILLSDVTKNQAQMAFLPSFNARATHGYNWGQSIDPFTNTFASDRVRTNNFAVVSSWEIFTGLAKRYQLDVAIIDQQRAAENVALESRNFKNEIASAYAKLQADHLIVKLYENQFSYSKAVYKAILAEEKTGKKTHFEKLRVESLLLQDSTAFETAKNNLTFSEFVLMQLINLPDSLRPLASFEILDEHEFTQKLKRFYDWQPDNLPEFQLALMNKRTAELQLKIAKAQQYPKLAINSAVGSGYSGRNGELVGNLLVPKPMSVQLRENFYQSAVLSLAVPIFNAYEAKSNVKLAEIQLKQMELDNNQLKIDLINAIERLLLDYRNENINRINKLELIQRQKEIYTASEKMYLSGVISYPEFTSAKVEFTKSQLDYLLSLTKCYHLLLILENIIN